MLAVWSCGAVVAAVEDEGVSKLGPTWSWEEGHEEFLDFGGVHLGVVHESEAPCEALDVGIDGESDIDVECVAEDNICGFASDSSEGEEFIHCARDFAIEIVDDGGHGRVDGLGFVAEEADGLDVGFDLLG